MSNTIETTPQSSVVGLTPGTWSVDPSHSAVGFVARHLMVTKVRGRFTSFTGTITIADDALLSKVEASVDVSSITTGDDGRDTHLRSADFFEVDQFPTMSFVSTAVRPDGRNYLLDTDLTIKGVTKPVTFELEFDGVETDPWGNTKAGFTAEAEISRKNWGLVWNAALESGGVVVSDKIKLQLDIQAARA